LLLTVFDVVTLKQKIAEKQEESLKPAVFTNPDLCAKINKDLKVMMSKVEKLNNLEKKVADLNDYIEMCELEGDESMLQDINISLDNLNKELFNKYLYHDILPIDLLIRTSGELRISNFMLFSLAYSELYFTDVYFPDFKEKEFDIALLEYQKRNRRFGGIEDETKNN